MTDDTAPDTQEERIFDNPAMDKTFDAMCDAFFVTAEDNRLTQKDAILVLACAAAAIAAQIYFGLEPETTMQDRSDDEKKEFREIIVGMVDEELENVLSLPAELCADDEEINPAEFMPGLNRVH